MVTTPVAAALLAGSGYPVTTPALAVVLLGSVASTTLWCLFGAALGALIRNQVAAVTVAFLWFFYAEWFLVTMVPSVGRWTPTGVGKAVSGWTRDGLTGFGGQPVPGQLLPMWAGGLVFLGYAVAARLISVRRDVA